MKTILSLFLLLSPLTAFAAGVSASPERLNFNVQNSPVTDEIIVANPSADVQLFEIYPDDFERQIKITPTSFTLESGERKRIKVTVGTQWTRGISSTNISVLERPLADSQVKISAGIKIPVTINSSGFNYRQAILPLCILLSTTLLILFLHKKPKE